MNLNKQRLAICKEILPYVNKYKLRWGFLLFLKALQKVPIFLQPLIFKFLIDSVIGKKNIAYLYVVAILYMGLYLLETLLKVGHRIIDNILFNKITSDLRMELWKKYLSMPFDKYRNYEKSDLVQRLNLDIDMMKFFLIGEVFDYITAVISIFISIGLIFFLEWRIAAAVCALLPLSLILANRYKGQLEELSEQNKKRTDEMKEKVQSISGIWKEVKANLLEKAETGLFETVLLQILCSRQEKERCLFKRNMALSIKGKLIDSLSIYIVGGLLHFFIAIPAGTVIACANYFDNILNDFSDIMEMDSNFEWVRPSVNRVIEMLNCKAENNTLLNGSESSVYEFEITGMHYGYNKSAKEVFSDFNFAIGTGEKILIDGASGNGKSTLVKLLTGDLKCGKGGIFYKGIHLNGLSEACLYHFIRKIDQEMYFMNITIKEYMRMSKRDASDEEIRQACKEANLWEDLKEIDSGFKNKIGENGSNLSGGQRQKLALARLFLIKDKTLLLDEAFSAIDVKDKIEILNRILERYHHNTIICVAHDVEIKTMFHVKKYIQ